MEKLQQNKFVIIIPTFKQEALFKKTLASLFDCVFPKELSKIIVVENGPKGDIEKIINRFKTNIIIEYIYEKLANKSNALNKVIKNIDNAYIILFDDDIRIDSKILLAYSSAFKQYGKGFFWGGPVGADYVGDPPPKHLLNFFPNSVKGFDLGLKIKEIYSPDFLGCNWAFHSDDIKEIGGFDRNFGPGSSSGSVGQESNAMDRLLKAGKKAIYLPDAKVWHYVPSERSSFKWLEGRHFKNGVRNGILTKKKLDQEKFFLGIPIWFYRFYFISLFNSKIKKYFVTDKSIKADYIMKHHHNRGMLKGFLLKD